MSFVVRIHCFSGEVPEDVVGVVETAGNEYKTGLTGIEELWSILNSANKTL